MAIAFDLWGQRGWAGFEVAGESFREREIRALLGSSTSEVTIPAQLVPEPNNRHDRNAVAVWCGPHHVGYLPREEAPRYTLLLSALVGQGWTPQVTARVWASDYHGEYFNASVRLDLAEPHMLVPANLPPSAAHRLIPIGNAIQVTGEEKHLDALAPYLRPEGECWAHVTLHPVVEQLARSTREVVEVRIDDTRVGQLTPKMSGELLPAIHHLRSRGEVAAARAVVKGNRLKTEVVLYVARAHELPDSWLRSAAPPGSGVVSPPAGSGASQPAGARAAAWTEPSGAPSPLGAGARPGSGAEGGAADNGAAHGAGARPGSDNERGAAGNGGDRSTGVGAWLPPNDPAPRFGVDSRVGADDTDPGVGRRIDPRTAGNGTWAGPTDTTAAGHNGFATAAGGHVARAAVPVIAGPPEPPPQREHAPIPPRPTAIRFTVPPGWPQPPAGWNPPPGWRPDPSWPPAPLAWQWWVPTWD